MSNPDFWEKYCACPQWLERRLMNNINYKVTFLNNTNGYAVLLVEKRSGILDDISKIPK
jgi:hypothetical protein